MKTCPDRGPSYCSLNDGRSPANPSHDQHHGDTGFEFIGWTDGDGTRVQVFALRCPERGRLIPSANGDPDLLERRDFASYRILSDQGIGSEEMRSLGLEPMILDSRQVVPSPLATQIEQARQAVEALRKAKPQRV